MANNNDKTIHERVLTDKERMLEELNKTSGIVSSACKAAGISRMTFYRWYNEDPDFKEKVDDVKELQKDFCEALILKKMKDGDTTMLIFYAKTQMKDRGYTERRELVGRDGEALVPKQKIDLNLWYPNRKSTWRNLQMNSVRCCFPSGLTSLTRRNEHRLFGVGNRRGS